MKNVPNLTFTIPSNPKPESTVSLLRICLQSQPQGGFDFNTMRKRMKVEAVLDSVKEGETLNLEDEYYEEAVRAIKETRWVSYGPHLVQFAELFGL